MNTIADTRKLLKLVTVQRQLFKLLAHFPGPGRTNESIVLIAPDYYEAFKGYYDCDFIALVGQAIRECKFFPTIRALKDIDDRNMESFAPFESNALWKINKWSREPLGEMDPETKKKLDEFLGRIGKDIE